mmetsp:Transcript_2418/g.5757  ORF Transcript_2418/g.5757 Transcript_2418/m.5757 type:complete len:238 (-) Transcript_2418:729-1442(-)
MQSRLKLSARDRVPDRSSYHGLSLELSENDRNAYIACGKALKYLTKVESHGACGLEKSSVYGAAVAIPQIARSSGWSATLTASSILSYFFLLLNISLQVYLLTVVAEAEILGSAFAGKMHLCDMGAKLEACPGPKDCQGPGGTAWPLQLLFCAQGSGSPDQSEHPHFQCRLRGRDDLQERGHREVGRCGRVRHGELLLQRCLLLLVHAVHDGRLVQDRELGWFAVLRALRRFQVGEV